MSETLRLVINLATTVGIVVVFIWFMLRIKKIEKKIKDRCGW